MLERMQADLVGLVGEASDLDEEILELRRKVSVVPEPVDMDASDGSTPRPAMRKKVKSAGSEGKKKVKIFFRKFDEDLEACARSLAWGFVEAC